MKQLGTLLYGIGAVLSLVAIVWAAAGIYMSQLPVFFLLGGAGIAAVFIGAKLNKDPNPNKAVAWTPTAAPINDQSTPAAITTAQAEPETRDDSLDPPDAGDMMNCPNCGTLTRVGAGFCGNCGAKLEQTAPLAPPPPPPPPTLAAPPPPPPEVVHMEDSPAANAKSTVVEETITEIEEPEEDDARASAPVTRSGMITPPPGIAAPPPAPSEPTPPSRASEPIFITAPGIPFVSPPAEDVDATRAAVRRRTGSPWRLVLPEGRQVVVDGTVLIGRDPAARAKWADATLLPLDDTTKSVSKTHAVIEVDAEGLWVTDLKSTNGVVVTNPDGDEIELAGSQRVQVSPGSDIELGDYIVQVEKD